MAEEILYILDEALGNNGGHFQARNADDVQGWLDKEFEYWGWLKDSAQQNERQEIRATRSAQFATLESLQTHTTAWKQNSANQDRQLQEIRRSLQQYRNRRVLHSSTPEAKMVTLMKKEVGLHEAAIAFLMTTTGENVNLSDVQNFHGAVIYTLFKEGYSKRTTASIRRALDELLKSINERNEKDTRTSHRQRDDLEKLVAAQDEIKERAVRLLAMSIRRSRKAAKQQRELAKDRLTELEELYRKKISLQAPISYWSGKRKKHRWGSTIAMSVLVIYLAVLLGCAIYYIPATEMGHLAFWKEAKLGIVGVLAVVAGVFAAIARIIYRLFLSQLHLGNDADERVTMIETYLALDDQGHAKEVFMTPLFERLFAPASDGMIKDDFGSIGAMDAIMKNIGKGR